jgi:hypothetical protein
LLGLGFPDHGSTSEGDFVEKLTELMTLMTPSIHTSATVVWIDDVIKINDGNVLDGVENIIVHEGIKGAQQSIEGLDRSRPQVLNTFTGSKYIYTKSGLGTSPTKWGYAHPTPEADYPNNPSLPDDYVNSRSDINSSYATTAETLTYLAAELREESPEIRFIKGSEVVDMIAVDGYWEVTADELDVLARWLLNYWGDGPPPFVSDGDTFYSLRDAFVLLAGALSTTSIPESQQLTVAYGPLESVSATGEVTVNTDDIRSLAETIAPDLLPPAAWVSTPTNMLDSSYSLGGYTLNAAQVLYGMAMVYAAAHADHEISTVDIPASKPMSQVHDLMIGLGCESDQCEGTAWSMKPARIHPIP